MGDLAVLRPGADYPIPDEAMKSHIAILGKTGSGKSNAAKTMIEGLLDAGERVCIVDPTGSWYGLRLKSDGTTPAYPVVIFGGQHADKQISRHHGAAVAEVVATSSTPAVIDTRLMTVGERTDFFTAFAETLLRKNRGPLHLVIDEAHIFAPQSGGAGGKNVARNEMLHAANNLVSLGRSIGLRIVLISQRPAKLHKDSLTQVETLVAMRLIHNLDVDAVKAWIGEWADPVQGKEIVGSLPALPTGDAWIWAPEIGVLKRAHFPLARTYDSGKAPSGDEAGPELQPIDLEKIDALLDKAAVDIKANDPKALKAEVARLTRELAAASKGSAPAWPDQRELVETLMGEMEENCAAMERLTANAKELQRRQEQALAALTGEPVVMAAAPAPVARRPTPAPAPVQRQPAPVCERAQSEGDATLKGPQRQMLQAIAWWAAMGHPTPSKAQVAAISGWRITSGHLKNVAGSLRTLGLIDYPQPGLFALTDAGREAAPEPDMGASFHDSLRGTLTGPQRMVFDHLLATGAALTREEMARAIGWEPTSGHVKNVLGSMRTLELLDYPAPGMVALQEWVTSA